MNNFGDILSSLTLACSVLPLNESKALVTKFVSELKKDTQLSQRYYFYSNVKNTKFNTLNEAQEFLNTNLELIKELGKIPSSKLKSLSNIIPREYVINEEINNKIEQLITEKASPSLAKVSKLNGLKQDVLCIMVLLPKSSDNPEEGETDADEYGVSGAEDQEDDGVSPEELAKLGNKSITKDLEELPDEERKEIEELFRPGGDKVKIYESYKAKTIQHLKQAAKDEQPSNKLITEAIKKIQGMNFSEESYLDDIVGLLELVG